MPSPQIVMSCRRQHFDDRDSVQEPIVFTLKIRHDSVQGGRRTLLAAPDNSGAHNGGKSVYIKSDRGGSITSVRSSAPEGRLGQSACLRTPAVPSRALRKPVVDRSSDLLADTSAAAISQSQRLAVVPAMTGSRCLTSHRMPRAVSARCSSNPHGPAS